MTLSATDHSDATSILDCFDVVLATVPGKDFLRFREGRATYGEFVYYCPYPIYHWDATVGTVVIALVTRGTAALARGSASPVSGRTFAPSARRCSTSWARRSPSSTTSRSV